VISPGSGGHLIGFEKETKGHLIYDRNLRISFLFSFSSLEIPVIRLGNSMKILIFYVCELVRKNLSVQIAT
jgi:hypothetical protein